MHSFYTNSNKRYFNVIIWLIPFRECMHYLILFDLTLERPSASIVAFQLFNLPYLRQALPVSAETS